MLGSLRLKQRSLPIRDFVQAFAEQVLANRGRRGGELDVALGDDAEAGGEFDQREIVAFGSGGVGSVGPRAESELRSLEIGPFERLLRDERD